MPIRLHTLCGCLHANTAELSSRTATIKSAICQVVTVWLFTENVSCLLFQSSQSQPGQPQRSGLAALDGSLPPHPGGGHSQPGDNARRSLL